MTTSNGDKPLKNNFVAILAIGLVLGFILGFMYNKVQTLEGGTVGNKKVENEQPADAGDVQPPAPTELSITEPDPDNDHWKGSKDARYVHVEYSDFECPFCERYYSTQKQVEEEYGDTMAMVFRHFPLSFHPKAQKSAEAAECVGDLGGNEAFWNMHDEIFEAMPEMELDELPDLAVNVGVNKAAFTECLDGDKFADKVQAQLNEGSKAGVAATPTSIIYDLETGESATIEGALPIESVREIIDDFIES